MGRDEPAHYHDAANRFRAAGVAAAIVTDIARDGAQVGVDAARLEEVANIVRLPVIASGGVANSTTSARFGPGSKLGWWE